MVRKVKGDFEIGKRSRFERNPRDFYVTPYEAVLPLLPHVSGAFHEPCAGDGALVRHLTRHGMECRTASDIEPQAPAIERKDVFDWRSSDCQFITNPAWSRDVLHPLILHLSDLAPCWLLYDAGWMFTRQSAPYMSRCSKIVAVGRLKWYPDTTIRGKEDCAWYLFDRGHSGPTQFVGRFKEI